MRTIGKTGYADYYQDQCYKNDDEINYNCLFELEKLDEKLKVEYEKKSEIFNQANSYLVNYGKKKAILSFDSLIEIGYSGYCGFYCAQCWDTVNLNSNVKIEVFEKLGIEINHV